MFKKISSLKGVQKLKKSEQTLISGARGGRLEICNHTGDPVICKTGHCIQYANGTWGCL